MRLAWTDDGVGGRTFEVRLHPQLRIAGGWLPREDKPELARYWADLVVADIGGTELGGTLLFGGQCRREGVEARVGEAVLEQLELIAAAAPPRSVLTYGDTIARLAGALNVPIAGLSVEEGCARVVADTERLVGERDEAFAVLSEPAPQHRRTRLVPLAKQMVDNLKRALAHCEELAVEALAAAPIPMVLHCPACGFQHVDKPDRAAGWENPPHRSHLCGNPSCNTVWRPADVATTGVARIETRGSADNWPPAATEPAR